ncbi:rna-directed dna polymerase from mobile element jockey-like [Limosa lapponica baueri]|uniref:Rna-directed dna polymerase from mobile element jockey-like n=1 Tax=Limosa lapponica baueri TaxID=1758121 RepID=A0A2I0T7T4_LIMLA|nr:rna-directed dna polymerase from mobile element jockey-like [Limosa lapponica baueri]
MGRSWESRKFLVDWKLANVVPVFKISKKEDIGNHRPVSLTSVPGKIVEKVILSLSKTLNSISLSIRPCGTPLVTGLQLDFVQLITTLWSQLFSQFSIHLTVHLSNPNDLTFVPGKVMEQIILSSIMQRMKDTQAIRPSQQGFMRGMSCLKNLISFYDKVTCLVEDGKAVDVLYLNFYKAFDTVSHSILLEKLAAHGLDGNTLHWVKNWLEAGPESGEPIPTSSKTDPSLTKAEPISDGVSASGITYLRKGGRGRGGDRNLHDSNEERGVRETVVKKEGEKVEQRSLLEQRFSLQPTVKTMVRQAVPL